MKKRVIRTANALILIISGILSALLIMYGMLTFLDMSGQGMRSVRGGYSIVTSEESENHGIRSYYELREANPDVTAWICISGTKINYPILQGKNDMEYVNKDCFGNYTLSGSLFLSVINSRDHSEPYQLVYGHHMENGSMFGDLDKFCDRKFFFNVENKRYEEQEGFLITDSLISELQIFAVIKTDAFDPIIYKVDKTGEELYGLIEYARDKALFFKEAGDVERIIALSTCDSSYTYGRTVVLCKVGEECKLPENEETGGPRIKKVRQDNGLKDRSFSLTCLAATLLELYLAFPVHLIGSIGIFRYRSINALCFLASCFSLSFFMITEDVGGRMVITDGWTMISILILLVTLLLRYIIYRKIT